MVLPLHFPALDETPPRPRPVPRRTFWLLPPSPIPSTRISSSPTCRAVHQSKVKHLNTQPPPEYVPPRFRVCPERRFAQPAAQAGATAGFSRAYARIYVFIVSIKAGGPCILLMASTSIPARRAGLSGRTDDTLNPRPDLHYRHIIQF